MKFFLKLFQQTGWQILGKIVTSASTLIILGIVTRNYGEAGTGVFSLALTYLAIFYLLSDFGFNAHVLRQATDNRQQATVEWQKLLGTRMLWSIILVILAVGSLPFWPFTTAEFTQAVLFGSLAIIASAILMSCNLIFQSKLRYDLSVLASSIGAVVSLAIFVYVTSLSYPIPFLLLAHFLGWVVTAILAVIFVKKIIHMTSPIFDRLYATSLFKQSWPIAVTLTLNVLYFRADAFMIAYFKSNAEVGIYNVAYQVFQSALVLPTFIMNAYYPFMLRSLKGFKFIGLGLFVLATLGTLLIMILAPLIIKILTGEGFVGSTPSLRILSLGFPAYFLSSLLMWILVTKGKYKSMLLIYGIGLFINLTLNFIFIPKASFYGASWVTVISEYIILMMQIFVLRGILL